MSDNIIVTDNLIAADLLDEYGFSEQARVLRERVYDVSIGERCVLKMCGNESPGMFKQVTIDHGDPTYIGEDGVWDGVPRLVPDRMTINLSFGVSSAE